MRDTLWGVPTTTNSFSDLFQLEAEGLRKEATQKPLGIIERIVKVHSLSGDILLDFFARSGTLGEVAAKHKRGFILVDNNPAAIEIMTRRLQAYKPEIFICVEIVEKDRLESIGKVVEFNVQ